MIYFPIDKKFADFNDKPFGQKFRGKDGYVARADRYNNLLDTAYADIVEKRKSAPQNLNNMNNNKKGGSTCQHINSLFFHLIQL